MRNLSLEILRSVWINLLLLRAEEYNRSMALFWSVRDTYSTSEMLHLTRARKMELRAAERRMKDAYHFYHGYVMAFCDFWSRLVRAGVVPIHEDEDIDVVALRGTVIPFPERCGVPVKNLKFVFPDGGTFEYSLDVSGEGE